MLYSRSMNHTTEVELDPLQRAISLAGGPAALARFITEHYPDTPITAQAICDWKQCPPKRVLQVERAAAEGAAAQGLPNPPKRADLRPDIYPTEQAA